MDRTKILDLYEWELGICVRHPSCGPIHTALAGVIHLPTGVEQQVRVCRDCMFTLEVERELAALSRGLRYLPGGVGQDA